MDIKKKIRMTVDLAMVILLPVLMGYSLVGETAHEIIGILMAALLAVHITLNRKWLPTIFRGKYNLKRTVTTAVNLLLIVCVIMSMVSGIMLSKHVFNFLNITFAASLMRSAHMLAAYWGFALMSFHAGTHGGMIIKNILNKWLAIPPALISLYGIYAFIKRGFVEYMFLKVQFAFFDFDKPFIFFYMDYLAVVVLFMTLGYMFIKLKEKRYKAMKRVLSVLLTIAMVAAMLGAFTIGYAEDFSLTMQIGSPVMTVNSAEKAIDDEGSTPVIVNARTLLPVRAVVEEMGGTVGWESDTRTAVLNYGGKEIRLVIDSKTAYLNGEATELDTAPAIINDRTMLPIRFIAESLDFTVGWDGDTQTITITKSDKTNEPDAVSSATVVTEEEPTATTEPEVTTTDGKTLIAYFSRAGENYSVGTIDKGNTSYIADYIAEQTGADVFEIIPVNPYPQGYEDTKTRATNERNSNARPEYVGEVENFEQYDVVFIGHPIWWGDMPMIMYTFLENHDFDGKTVCQFNTHEGSGNAGTALTIKNKLPNATITDYLAVYGSAAQKNDAALKTTIDSWLKKLGYIE